MFRNLLSTTTLAGLILTAASCSDAAKSSAKLAPAKSQVAINRPILAGAPLADHGKLLEEAVSALRETKNALAAIDQNKPGEAIAALERATGKLEIVLARSPDLALAPVDIAVSSQDLLATVQDVQTLRAEAKAAMDQGRLQDARMLIANLGSETDISVANLPLATYPTAIKQAAALLHQGKAAQAKLVLEAALSTIVIKRTVIPLPLVRAEAAVEAAKSLSEKANRTPAENNRLRSLLGTARAELGVGQALGYATEKDMSDLIAAVNDIDRRTSGQQHSTGLFDRIGTLFDTARRSSQAQTARR